jgi:asparagine synthase (glutamine-hydrolysing)
MGFPVPIGKWIRGSERRVIDEYVLGERSVGRGLFDRTFVTKLVEEHQRGAVDHSERLWSLVNFEIWYRTFFEDGCR